MTADRDHTQRPGAAAAAAFAVSVLVCALYCWSAAANMWPLIDGDGPAYFPAATEWSRGHQLTNPLWLPPLNDSIDGPGSRRYVYHGFLYQLVVGALGRQMGPAPLGVIRAAYLLHWLAAVLSALAVFLWARASGLSRVIVAALLPLAMLAFSVAWHGRMEPLAILLVAGGCLAWRYAQSPLRDALCGLAVVLLGWTSPACGALGGLVLLAALARNRQPLLRPIVAATGGGAAGMLLGIAWYPYPISAWVEGVLRHSRINFSLAAWQGFTATWLTRPELPLLLLSILVFVAGAARHLIKQPTPLDRTAVLFWICVALFGVGLWRVAAVKTEASYNAIVWVPLLASLTVSSANGALGTGLLIVALALPTVGLARSSVVLATVAENGPTFGQLQQRLGRVRPDDLVVSPGLWLALNEYTHTKVARSNEPFGRTFVLQQAYLGRSTPPAYSGYRLVENHFGRAVTIMGVPIARTGAGWSYAIYERADAP